MTTLDPKWIDAGTLALQVNLYGEDLGRAATGDAYDDEEAYHREQVTDILAAVVPLIVAKPAYTPPAGQRCGHGHDPRHNGSSLLYQRVGCGCYGVCCMGDHEAPAPVDTAAIRARWSLPCGSCDSGLPMACTHPDEDPRGVIMQLCNELDRVRAQIA